MRGDQAEARGWSGPCGFTKSTAITWKSPGAARTLKWLGVSEYRYQKRDVRNWDGRSETVSGCLKLALSGIRQRRRVLLNRHAGSGQT
jgi:hypothetical protein